MRYRTLQKVAKSKARLTFRLEACRISASADHRVGGLRELVGCWRMSLAELSKVA